MTTRSARASLYRTIWRWHFYAGLFVMPMVVVLALTGAAYLFKPQIDHWEERAFTGAPDRGSVSADVQVAAALAAYPGAGLHAYRLPEREGDAVLVHIGLPGRQGMRDVFVSPQGKVVGALDSEWRIAQVLHEVHGQLMLGRKGSWLVELAASWAIVMIVSGLYLWWPRGSGLAGVVWPRLDGGSRVFWRDLHAVTGFWVSGLALVLLVTGLPWADAWGSAFKAVRAEMGWQRGVQAWTVGGKAPAMPAEHDHAAMMAGEAGMAGMAMMDHAMPAPGGVSFAAVVAEAKSRHLPFPVMVSPPGAPQPFGAPSRSDWTVRSDTQNRPQAVTLHFDPLTGAETGRETFADKHPIDRVVGYGVAWHEGALFGWVNQLIGLMTAAMLVTLAVSGFVMWRRRKPADALGAPAPLPGRIGGVAVIVCGLAAFLPLLALSLVMVLVVEQLALRRVPGVARWLGLSELAR